MLGGGIGYLTLAAAGGTSLVMSGCDVYTEIFNWAGIGLDSFNEVVNLLEDDGVISPVVGAPITVLITAIQAGLAQIKADVQEYKSTTPPPIGTLAKIELALSIAASNFQAFLTSIRVSDNKLAQLVIGAITIILNAIGGFVSQLGNAVTNPTLRSWVLKRTISIHDGIKVEITPTVYSDRSFKRAFNKVMRTGGHSERQLHMSMGEHLSPSWI